MEEISADVLVAGGGIGGLMAAYHAQASGARVLLLGGSPGASNRISSFNTALHAAPEDTPAGLFNDILLAGGFINQPAVVAAMGNRIGPETLLLADLGVPFHREDGRLARRQAAGSSWPRAVYSLGMVGADIRRQLLKRLSIGDPTVQRLDDGLLLDLHVHDGMVTGGLAYVPTEQRWLRITAPAVVLATGGAGRLFGNTTNPPGSQGTGYALALEAGASLIDMEFVSFEPFVTAAPPNLRGRDLPTTVLREGARLRNGLGEEFLDTTRAPSKDVICRAMVREVREGRGTPAGAILYDLRGMPEEVVARYVQIQQVLKPLGTPASEAQIEVMPAQHYLMGGVRVDERAAAELPGLYAVGEVAGGAHGAHRLAACGGTEVVAMGAIAGESAAQYSVGRPRPRYPEAVQPRPEFLSGSMTATDRERLGRIRAALEAGCGILRDADSLGACLGRLRKVQAELQAEGRLRTYVGRAVLVALAIAIPALARAESRGDHFRTDYPERDDQRWLGNLVVRASGGDGTLTTTFERAGLGARRLAPLPAD